MSRSSKPTDVLIVIDGFENYVKGDEIEDTETVTKILESENSDKVIKIRR